jgi:D-alanine-D-alanine ligase
MRVPSTAEIQKLAIRAFKAIDDSGLWDDRLLLERSTERLILNKINTLPGFTSIWEASDVSDRELFDRLIEPAFQWNHEINEFDKL